VGIGVEQLQTELKKYFPQAKIASFERAVKAASIIASDQRERSNLPVLNDFDILISTQAILRFQATWQAHMAAFIDFDAELNRLDMRSAFNAFSLAMHISSMAQESVFIQTRNSSHYVLQNLSRGNFKGYYDEELKLRKEWGFSPFKHWIKISWRGKLEKSTHEAATQVYNELSKSLSEKNYILTPPLPDAIGRKRGQFRFNVMVQANDILLAVSFIRFTLTKIKRPRRIIVTLNIDP
jgi:primosomal protein N' (replication factor Y)